MLETKGSECDSSITLPSEVINSKIVGGLCRGLEYEEKRRIRQEKTPTAIRAYRVECARILTDPSYAGQIL